MVHLVYCDNVGKNGEKELDKIILGTKHMVVRGAAGRKIPHSRVKDGEMIYFMEKGTAKISAKGIVKSVQNYVKLKDDEITKIIEENQSKLNLTEKQKKEYEKEGRQPAIRFKVDTEKDYKFDDFVHDQIKVEKGGVGDFVLLRSDNLPVYNFAVVIDDHLMGITHVLRGDDHLYNTLRQVMLYDTFGWERPKFAHLSMILAPDKSKLSKRAGVEYTFIEEFKEIGVLKDALNNYLALLGWSPEGEKEIMSMEEMVEEFEIERVSPSPAVFDFKKLKWMNGKYIRKISDKKYYELVRPFVEKYFQYEDEEEFKKAVDLIRDSLEVLDDVKKYLKGILKNKDGKYELNYSEEIMKKFENYNGKIITKEFIKILEDRDSKYIDLKEVYSELQEKVEESGKALFQSLRIAVTGDEHGPDMIELFSTIKRDEIIKRCKDII